MGEGLQEILGWIEAGSCSDFSGFYFSYGCTQGDFVL